MLDKLKNIGVRSHASRGCTNIFCIRVLPLFAALFFPSAYAVDSRLEVSQSLPSVRPIEEVIVSDGIGHTQQAVHSDRGWLSFADIHKSPALSIADSLVQLPGVAGVNKTGNTDELNVRGLASEFVFATLNGREQLSPNFNRSIRFGEFPAALIHSVQVVKSPNASLIEGGVAANVDLKTLSPLDAKQQFSHQLTVEGGDTDHSSSLPGGRDLGYRLSLISQGKSSGREVGYMLSAFTSAEPLSTQSFEIYPYNLPMRDITGDGVNDSISDGYQVLSQTGESKREGYTATLEWRPSDKFTLQTDWLYLKNRHATSSGGFGVHHLHQAYRQDEINIFNADIIANSIVGGRFIKRPRAYNFPVESPSQDWLVKTINQVREERNTLLSGALALQWRPANYTVDIDYSISTADNGTDNLSASLLAFEDGTSATPFVDQAITFDFRSRDLLLPELSFNREYLDLDSMLLADVAINPVFIENEVEALHVDVSRTFDCCFVQSVQGGIRISERNFLDDRNWFQYGSDSGIYHYVDNSSGLTVYEPPSRLSDLLVTTGSFRGDFDQYPNFIWLDMDAALTQWLGDDNNYRAQKTWQEPWPFVVSGGVKEKVQSAYLMTQLAHQFNDISLSGNVGVRFVHSDQRGRGIVQVGLGQGEEILDDLGVASYDYSAVVQGKQYTDVLPSMTLTLSKEHRHELHFSAARVMSRPPIHRLKAGAGSWIANGVFNTWGSTSPLLDPFYANQAELSYSYIFNENKGSFNAAYFIKDIQSFVELVTIENFDFRGAGFPVPEQDPVSGNPIRNGQYQTAINNDKGGDIKGIELSFTGKMTEFTGLISGISFNINYARNFSHIKRTLNLSGASVEASMPGLSDHIVSSYIKYKNKKWSLNLGANYRSDFTGRQILAGKTQEVIYKGSAYFDMYASVNITKSIKLIGKIKNITREPIRTFYSSKDILSKYQDGFRYFSIGFVFGEL